LRSCAARSATGAQMRGPARRRQYRRAAEARLRAPVLPAGRDHRARAAQPPAGRGRQDGTGVLNSRPPANPPVELSIRLARWNSRQRQTAMCGGAAAPAILLAWCAWWTLAVLVAKTAFEGAGPAQRPR